MLVIQLHQVLGVEVWQTILIGDWAFLGSLQMEGSFGSGGIGLSKEKFRQHAGLGVSQGNRPSELFRSHIVEVIRVLLPSFVQVHFEQILALTSISIKKLASHR